MSAQSLLHSVFSCSSPASSGAASAKGFSKRKLRQTRSLDPALIGGCGAEAGTEGGARGSTAGRLYLPQLLAEGLGPRSASSPRSLHPRASRLPPPRPLCSSFSTPSTPQEKSPSGSFHFDYEVPLCRSGLKKSTAWDLPSVLAGSASGRSASSILCSSGGGPNGIFASPRRWLQQRKFQPPPNSRGHPYFVCKSETIKFFVVGAVLFTIVCLEALRLFPEDARTSTSRWEDQKCLKTLPSKDPDCPHLRATGVEPLLSSAPLDFSYSPL